MTVDGPDGGHETVPVVWFAAPARAASLDVDTEVVVGGRVRRRFYRANGALASRTEVVAEVVLPAGHRKRVLATLRDAVARAGVEPAAAEPG